MTQENKIIQRRVRRPNGSPPMQQRTIRVEAQTWAAINEHARGKRLSTSEWIRRTLLAAIERGE